MPVEVPGLLTRAECETMLGIAAHAAASKGVRDVELLIGAEREALTRFANNAIHQNVAQHSRNVSVRVLENQRTARSSTNGTGEAAIRAAVAQAIEMARCLEADPEMLPLAEPASVTLVERFHPGTAGCSPEDRARAVRDAVAVVEAAGQTAAGIYSTEASAEAIVNTRGLFAMHAETAARFSITAMAADSSGWAKASATDLAAFDPVALARRAVAKAAASAAPREIEPGAYTVILEPAAVLDLVGQIFADFSATAIEDQRSFLTDRLGEKIFGENISISDDVYHPRQSGAPFDGEGVPRRRLRLVESGVPREVAWGRPAASKKGVAPTGHGYPVPNETGEAPQNIVIAGGDATVESMIAATQRGILVTRLWYIREVDPYEKIMTGMTRDGTFLVEDGKVVCGLRNFRFNQSVVEFLNNVRALSPCERTSGEEAFDMVVPAMLVDGFQFTEVTRF